MKKGRRYTVRSKDLRHSGLSQMFDPGVSRSPVATAWCAEERRGQTCNWRLAQVFRVVDHDGAFMGYVLMSYVRRPAIDGWARLGQRTEGVPRLIKENDVGTTFHLDCRHHGPLSVAADDVLAAVSETRAGGRREPKGIKVRRKTKTAQR